MSSFGRLDVVVLAVMLVYIFVVFIHVCRRYYVARGTAGADSAGERGLVASLNIRVGNLNSIAITAPYFGLAGTCIGILDALSGYAMQSNAFRTVVAIRIAVALIPTTVAMPVAVLATCSHSYLRALIDSLANPVSREGHLVDRRSHRARRFPAVMRLPELPAFALLSVSGLAIAITGYMTFASLHAPTGFYVGLAPAHCEYDEADTLIVLHIRDSGKLFLNEEDEDWNGLADRLSQIYGMRAHRAIYLLADSGVRFDTVARAIDTVENAEATVGSQADGMRKGKLDIKVWLVTPETLNAGCRPVRATSF